KLPYVDSERLYVAGHSVGGTLALLATLASERFRAAASFSGAPNFARWLQLQRELAPFDASDAGELRIRSAVLFASSFRRPVRVFHGLREGWCYDQSEQLELVARQKGVDVRAIGVPGDHFSAVSAEIEQAIAFFRATP